jgi:hypothetical protein
MPLLRASSHHPKVERSPRSPTSRGGRSGEPSMTVTDVDAAAPDPVSGLQRSARPVKVKPDTSLRSRSKSHGAQLSGVRVDIVERDAEIRGQLARTDKPESRRADASDLHNPPCCSLGNGVNVLCAQLGTRDSSPRRIRMPAVHWPRNRGRRTRVCGSLLTHSGLWIDRYRSKGKKGRNLQSLPVRQPSRDACCSSSAPSPERQRAARRLDDIRSSVRRGSRA